jgi:hypothetical protein
VKIGDPGLTDLSAAAVADPSKYHIPVVDQTAGSPGTDLDGTFAAMIDLMTSRIITATSHGLISGQVGYTLAGVGIYDDTDYSQQPSHVLLTVIDANTLRVAPPGSYVSIAVALIEDGNAYDIDAKGRFVYWDASESSYAAELPYDSAGNARTILEVLSVGSTTFFARVL